MNTYKIREAFQKAQPLIDNLVDTFIDNGWSYSSDDLDAQKARYKFDFSNLLHPKLTADSLDTDRLGSYQVEDVEYDEPGRRILFAPSILKASDYLKIHLSELSIENIIESLTAIVALHETTHWIMHSFTSPAGNRVSKEGPFDNTTLFFDEGLAQYFTKKIIENDPMILSVFNELCKHQPKQYKIYKQCESNTMKEVLDQLADPLVLRSQAWDLLVECIANINKDLAIRNYIDKSKADDTFERFRKVLKIHRSDLSDGPHNTGIYRGRIIAKAFGM